MKLGTLKDNSRDGCLVVVSQDNRRACKVESIAKTLQQAIDQWSTVEPQLQKTYEQLNEGKVGFAFDVEEKKFQSPFPRAYQWLDGSAFIQHIILVRKARGAALPETLKTIPLMYQGGSDTFLSPYQDIPLVDESYGLDFEAEVVVVTDFVPLGTKEKDAAKHIKLLMICNDVSLRGLIPDELARGFGFLQSKPSSAFAPFALTPDELGVAWKEGRLHLDMESKLNGKRFGNPNAGEMFFPFFKLIEHAAMTRDLGPGTLIGSGTVSNEDASRGCSCIAEKRMLEKIEKGEAITSFMNAGDHIQIEMRNESNENLFGSISQRVTKV